MSTGYRVLSIDDSATVRAVLERALRVAGIEVARYDEAATGAEGLVRIRTHAYDLVFCDLNMPGMSGFELVEELRRDGLLERAPLLIVSSLAAPGAVEELLRRGARGYLRKPIRPEGLRRLVDRVMGATHGPAV